MPTGECLMVKLQVTVIALLSILTFGVSVALLGGTDGERITKAILIAAAVAWVLAVLAWRANRVHRHTKQPTLSEILQAINAIVRGDKQ